MTTVTTLRPIAAVLPTVSTPAAATPAAPTLTGPTAAGPSPAGPSPAGLPLPGVVGFVEALTVDRLLGWAWAPGSPDLRAVIELRLGETVIAETIADRPRADLQSSGIGDGRHAFDLEIPSTHRSRSAELRVFARAGGHEAMPIGAPPAADGLSDQVSKVLRGVDMLLNSQRLIHRNLQTALTAPKDSEAPALEATLAHMSDLQAGIEAQLSAVERFVVRLDEQLSRLAPEDVKVPAAAKRLPPIALTALGVSLLAFIVSVAGLVRALGG